MKSLFNFLVLAVVVLSVSGCAGPMGPMFARWRGEASLAEAESSKKVQIEDAKGKYEAAKMLAQAEVERAKGVAEANKIIGESLKGNESYLRYLWIQNLDKSENNGGQVIYVPTEANLPILEASRIKK